MLREFFFLPLQCCEDRLEEELEEVVVECEDDEDESASEQVSDGLVLVVFGEGGVCVSPRFLLGELAILYFNVETQNISNPLWTNEMKGL